jgi:hypothetical protein
VDLGTSLAAAAAVEVDIRTAHTPPLIWTPDDAPTSSSGSGGGGGWSLKAAFLRWLRPELTVRSAFGDVHRAPYGSAGVSTWPLVPVLATLVALVVLALAGVGLVTVGRLMVKGR